MWTFKYTLSGKILDVFRSINTPRKKHWPRIFICINEWNISKSQRIKHHDFIHNRDFNHCSPASSGAKCYHCVWQISLCSLTEHTANIPLMTFHMQGICIFFFLWPPYISGFANQNLNWKELTITLTDRHISDLILHVHVKFICLSKRIGTIVLQTNVSNWSII